MTNNGSSDQSSIGLSEIVALICKIISEPLEMPFGPFILARVEAYVLWK